VDADAYDMSVDADGLRMECYKIGRSYMPGKCVEGFIKKVKVGFFYSATYLHGDAATSRAVQSQEVAVDWQEPMVRESNAAATTHTTAPINHTRPSPSEHSPDGAAKTSDYSLLLSLSTSKG